jgi:hypothetical protein
MWAELYYIICSPWFLASQDVERVSKNKHSRLIILNNKSSTTQNKCSKIVPRNREGAIKEQCIDTDTECFNFKFKVMEGQKAHTQYRSRLLGSVRRN